MALLDKIQQVLSGRASPQDEKSLEMSNDESQLQAYVRSKVEEVRASGTRISHESIWMTNIAYVLGFDSIFFDTTQRQFRSSNYAGQYLRRNRLHANKLLPAIQNRLSRLCKNPPKWDVRPNNTDHENKEAARLSKQILESWWDQEELATRRAELYMWLQQVGHCYGKVLFDDNAGKHMVDPVSGDVSFEGQVKFEIVPAFEVFADPLAKTLDDAKWIVHARIRKLDYFRAHYPDRGQFVEQEDAWLLSLQYENRINSINAFSGQAVSGQKPMTGAAIELIYYERRTKNHPNGRMVIVANGVLLKDDELPCGEIPLVMFKDVVVGGKYYPESLVTHARPLQDQFNRILNMKADWTNKMLTGKYLAPKGHGISQEAMNDKSGEIVEYNPQPGGKIEALQVPIIPNYAYEETAQLEKEINEIFGIGEVSKGQLPSASIPYAGMAFLQEQDETRIGVVTEQLELAWSKVLKLVLMYVGSYYEMPRILKIAGKNAEYQVKQFVGADLKDNFDVHVIRGSTVPGSKVLKRQEIISLHSQGYLGDPADPKVREKVLDMLEYGDIAEAWLDHGVDMAQIKEQIDEMEQGVLPPEIHELDNHELHVEEKNRYRKTDKFRSLPPQIQAIFEVDIERHVQQLMSMANPQMAAEQKLAPQLKQTQDAVAQMSPQELEQASPALSKPEQPKSPQSVIPPQGADNQ